MTNIAKDSQQSASADQHFILRTSRYEPGQSEGQQLFFMQKFDTLGAALFELLNKSLPHISPDLAPGAEASYGLGSLEIQCLPSGHKVSVGMADEVWFCDDQVYCKLGIISQMPPEVFCRQVNVKSDVYQGSDWPVFIPLLAIYEDNTKVPYRSNIASLIKSLQEKMPEMALHPSRTFLDQKVGKGISR